MALIRVVCNDQNVSFLKRPNIYSGDVNTDEVEFTFSDIWAGYTKTAVFYVNENDPYKVNLDANNRVIIPAEVLSKPGKLYFGVFGIKGDLRLTSEEVSYKIGKGSISTGNNPSATPANPFGLTVQATDDGVGNVTLTIGGS